jgi:hypothetical protein
VHTIGSQESGQRPALRPRRPDGFFVALSRAADHSVLRHAARVAACAGEPLEVTLDGEIAGALPGAFEVAGNALRVITPLGFVDKDDDIAEGWKE